MLRLSALAAVSIALGCVRLDADHCANQGDPLAYCAAQHQLGYCSTCRAADNGCDAAPPDSECAAGDTGQAQTTAASTEGGSSMGSASMTSGSTSGSTGPSSTDPSVATSMTDATADSSTGELPPGCGNHEVEMSLGENCDGIDMPAANCSDVGLSGGELGCYPEGDPLECHYDLSMCVGAQQCGNNVIEGTEPCDGTDLGGQTCMTVSDNYIGGTLGCRPACDLFDTSQCEMCRVNGQSCDAQHTCCGSQICGLVTHTCGVI